MIIELSEFYRERLLAEPETGMGWQAVDVRFRNLESARMIALNADFLVSNERELRQLIDVKGRINELVLRAAAREQRAPDILSLRVVAGPPQVVRESKGSGKPAKDAPEQPTNHGDEFRRFSAFEQDRRITADGGLLPGTYGTTAEDARYVRTGADAVRRYALPNPDPAKYEFVILPLAGTIIQEGIVEPAYGQPGGGVEVIFVKGSPSKTVTRGRTLPDS